MSLKKNGMVVPDKHFHWLGALWHVMAYIIYDGLVQDCGNSSALAME